MSPNDVIRAWKDPVYRNSLTDAERSALPANPAGSIELSDTDLGKHDRPQLLQSSWILPPGGLTAF